MPIFLEPSRDIHVVMGAGTPQLRLRVFEQGFSGATNRFTYNEVTPACTFDYFAPGPAIPGDPPNRLYSSVDPATGIVTAIAKGINLVQIRLPKGAGNPSPFLIARIEVHSAMNGWWLGNDSLTAALDTVAHSRVSIYALFDFNAAEGPQSGVAADITGHGYVPLASGNPALFQLDADNRGLIRGLQEGDAQLTATFMGKTDKITVKVVNFDKESPAQRVDYRGRPDTKFNMLFLSEGFSAGDRDKFDKAVEKVKSRLFDAHRHSPYNRLKESFNVWKAFVPARDRGAAIGPDLTANGDFIPFATQPAGNAYSLDQFVEIVGFPTQKEAAMDNGQLRTRWQGLNLSNYTEARADNPVVNGWKQLVPRSKLQIQDTAFGFIYGTRKGDHKSEDDDPANPVTAATAAAQPQRYQARMFEWFKPILVSRLLTLDQRRLAREEQMSNAPVVKFISRLIDPNEPAGSPHRNIGALWVPTAAGFARNRGLVCLIVNDEVDGGANIDHRITTSSAAGNSQFTHLTLVESTAPVRVRRLSRNPNVNPDYDRITDTVAHEFGHTFQLADEYEEFQAVAGATASLGDNVVIASAIQLAGAPANPALPMPIDPDRVPWFDLLRIELSDAIIEPAQVVGDQLRLKFGHKRAKRWKKAKDANTQVFLRGLNVRADGTQLPILHDDANLVANVQVIAVEELNDVVVIGGIEMPSPPPAMPAGSVLFVPKRKDGQLAFVVPKEVIDFVTASHLPLTENHNAADPSRCDPVSTDPDVPPPGVPSKHFPSNHYEVIGAYEGGARFVGGVYRPAGSCKMRSLTASGNEGKFCFVCKYLLVNRVDASRHDELDDCEYPEDC